ncbi:MAG: CDP-diacylglycerol--glycerol-3-phosphate 3-phosphatidyltransferase [Pseudomonadota bacterium]
MTHMTPTPDAHDTVRQAPNTQADRERSLALALPNLLTYGRLAAVPLLAACLYFWDGPNGRFVAAAIFALASLTDFLDGYLARIWEQQSNMGRMLDPIADKLLVSVTLLMLIADGTISELALWAALIILAREIVVSGLREFLAELNVKLHVSWLAKWKTVVQMLALFVLLIGPTAAGDLLSGFDAVTLGIGLLWMSAVLTIYTGWDYLLAALKHVG